MPVTVTIRAAGGHTEIRTLPTPAVSAPNPPTGLRVVGATGTTVSLDWNDSPDLRPGDKYQIYVDDVWAQLESTTSQYTATVSPGTHQFRVSAGKPGSYSSWTAPVPGATTATPSTPVNRPTNPFLLAYHDTAVMSPANVAAWAKPGALIITGRNNYALPWVKSVAAGGATVLVYLHPHLINTVGRYPSLLFNASQFGGKVPDWPGGPWRVDEWGFLGDFRPGSLLNQKLSGVLNLMITENPHISGFFFDGLGSTAAPGAGGFNWNTFPDKELYRQGAIEQCQIIRGICETNNLMAIANGNWDATKSGGYPDRTRHGCSLVDGGMVELHPPVDGSGWANQYSTLPTAQWGLGIPRIANLPVPRGYMVYISSTRAEMDQWVGYNVAAWASYGAYDTVAGPWRSTFTDFKVPNRKV